MRRRLLVVLGVFSVITVAGFTVPLLDQRAAAGAQTWSATRASDLDRFAALAGVPEAHDELVSGAERHARLYGEGVLVTDRTRRTVVTAGVAADDPGVGDAVDAALRAQPAEPPERILPTTRTPILLWRPVGTGARVEGAVVVRADPSRAAEGVAQGWLVVIAGAVVAAGAFTALALALARWIVRPIRALTAGVGAVARGHAGEQIEVADGPVELRALAEEFNRMSAVVRANADEQERLVADASHQIRNPLAALRLRVDGLEDQVADEGRVAYEATLGELDRLERLLDGMLGLVSAGAAASAVATGGPGSPTCLVGEVAAGRAQAWGDAARRAGTELRVAGADDVLVGWPAADLEQVLDVLIDNAVHHTPRGSLARVDWATTDDQVRIAVVDDGPGLDEDELPHAVDRFWRSAVAAGDGSGLGLAIARRLTVAHGGALEVRNARDGGLEVTVTTARVLP